MTSPRKIFSSLRHSSRFHNIGLFLGFVVVATIFWFMMAMNDSIQRECTVKLQIDNVPDSVTFITPAPASLHVTVRDQGTKLIRSVGFRSPTMHINFKDYSDNGLFRFSASDMLASLKGLFGKSASVLSLSLDSLRLDYSTGKGRQVPVVVVSTLEAAPGTVLTGKPTAHPSRVTIHGPREIIDTITRVYTSRVSKTDIKEPVKLWADLIRIPNVRIIPERVEININAEPLVRREETIEIKTIHVPEGINLVLFPSKVAVEFYVPMSKFGEEAPEMTAVVDYSRIHSSNNGKLGVTLLPVHGVVSPSLRTDSVEYSVVR